MRWNSHENMDIFETPPAAIHSDRLRQLVDSLPAAQRHLVERTFFSGYGGGIERASKDIGLTVKQGKVQLALALETIKAKVLKDHELGALLATLLG